MNKRNTELQWKPLPALIVLPTHLEHILNLNLIYFLESINNQ